MIDAATLAQAARLLEALRRAGLRVVTAESCTGGLVAAALTHHPGSSTAVLGGFVTYSDEIKHRLLGVETALLKRVGAVSSEVAASMADGALARSGADLAVSITGIAGPGGATASKPVGLVWFGIAARSRPTATMHRVFPGDRTSVRSASVGQALSMLATAVGSWRTGATGLDAHPSSDEPSPSCSFDVRDASC